MATWQDETDRERASAARAESVMQGEIEKLRYDNQELFNRVHEKDEEREHAQALLDR